MHKVCMLKTMFKAHNPCCIYHNSENVVRQVNQEKLNLHCVLCENVESIWSEGVSITPSQELNE